MLWTDAISKTLGLTETERAILIALDIHRNIPNIAHITGLSRTGITYSLKQLHGRGLVSQSRTGRFKTHKAIDIDVLKEMLFDVIDNLGQKKVTGRGARIQTSRTDEFIIHIGVKEISPAYKRIASECRGSRIQAIQSNKSWKSLLDKYLEKDLVQFNDAIIKNKIIVDGILQRNAYIEYKHLFKKNPEKLLRSAKSLMGRAADYTFVAEQFFDFNTEIWFFLNTTLVINWDKEVAIEITNADITGFLKDMFTFVKAGGKKVDHNQAMKEIVEGAS